MKGMPVFGFGDKMLDGLHKLIHLVGKNYEKQVFETLQIIPQNEFSFSGFRFNDRI